MSDVAKFRINSLSNTVSLVIIEVIIHNFMMDLCAKQKSCKLTSFGSCLSGNRVERCASAPTREPGLSFRTRFQKKSRREKVRLLSFLVGI